MAQPQRLADVYQNELCLSKKRYALMDANTKTDLDNPLYPNESKIMANIIQNHQIRFSVVASSSVSWIYMGQIFHVPQATDNDHERFVAFLKFSKMVPFFLNTLGFTLKLRSPSNFKMTGLVQLWQTLGKIFAQCLTIARDKYHNLEDDVMVKKIFNSWKHKDNVGMRVPSWMITDEMKLTNHYRMYDVVFRVDVPMTQSQPIESTQGTHRTLSAPRSPNPKTYEGEASALRKSTIIRLRIPQRRSTRLTPPTQIATTAEADDIILQDTIQLSLAELKPMSDKESLKVEITAEVQPVNINEEEEESAKDDYELKRREKGNHVEEYRSTPSPTIIRSLRTHSTLISSYTKKL
nr:hypothetical protein [Tanacetum cinerariifolium]